MTAVDWTFADPLVEIDRQINVHREDQRIQVQLCEEAFATELAAMDAVDKARKLQALCQEAIDADAAEINRLLEERQTYIPEQRRGQ